MDACPEGTDRAGSRAAQGRNLADEIQAALEDELNPAGIVETLLTREVARRAAQLEEVDQARQFLVSESEVRLAHVLPTSHDRDGRHQATISKSAAASPAVELLARRGNVHGRALVQTANLLQQTVAKRRAEETDSAWVRDPRFRNEAACCRYLVRRFSRGLAPCSRCGEKGRGCWIASRQCWQCAHCHAQTCIRTATVMERSQLPLATWFFAIKIVLFCPQVATADLGRQLGINRVPTVRFVRKRIRQAMDSENASQRLAGLDQVYLPRG